MTKKIGFVGLGTMGSIMAKRLLIYGYSLNVWNRTRDKCDSLVNMGASISSSPAEIAGICDVVFTMTTDSNASKEVILGKNGILAGAKKGLIIIDTASIAPEATRLHAKKADEKGVALLDAPVSGGPKVAENGSLGIMVGGSKKAFEQTKYILEELGSLVNYTGSSGNGSTLKLIANLVMGVTIQASAEAIVLANKIGIDPQLIIDITSLPGTGPQTGAMATRGPRMIAKDFYPPHFSANNMHKDLYEVLQLGEAHGVSLPSAATSLKILSKLIDCGDGSIDSSAIINVLEKLSSSSKVIN